MSDHHPVEWGILVRWWLELKAGNDTIILPPSIHPSLPHLSSKGVISKCQGGSSLRPKTS